MRTRLSKNKSKAANAVLGNGELVTRILGHVPRKAAFRDASFQLALTCKAISSAALDSLWRIMNNLIPLLDLLPGLEAIDEGPLSLVVQDVSKLHLSPRFKGYARRIRRVVVNTTWTSSIPSAIYAILLKRLATDAEALLPNARSIYIKSIDTASFHPCLFMLLINSSIQTLDMAEGSSFAPTLSHNASVFASQVAEDLVDTLQSLTVSNMAFTGEDDSAWLALCRLRSLRSLTLLRGSRPIPSIPHILPLFMRLHELKIDGGDIPKSKVPFVPVAANLTTLTIECHGNDIPPFLAQHSFPSLTKLSLTAKDGDDDARAPPVHKWIDAVCDALTDTAPMVSTMILSWYWPQVFAASLVPFVHLPNMEHLHFQSFAYRTKLQSNFKVEDNELSFGVLLGAIASSSLKTFVYPPSAGLVSMSVFDHIRRFTSSLETVHLCIDSD
ncbi:hypothetical protein BKA70DRAFT_10695 [Coprinopsis sp. MPI-PUGE-AT-0042]|nr:hypothetical protein BKA70DRAFT_10695 [Coprinopsis sp. MPI-PUGE-AT-0042]